MNKITPRLEIVSIHSPLEVVAGVVQSSVVHPVVDQSSVIYSVVDAVVASVVEDANQSSVNEWVDWIVDVSVENESVQSVGPVPVENSSGKKRL